MTRCKARKAATAAPKGVRPETPEPTLRARDSVRSAWITGAAVVLASIIGAIAGPWLSFLGAQSGSTPAPAIRIEGVRWKNPANHEFVLTGTVQNLTEAHRVWAFSSIVGGSGRHYAAEHMCDVTVDGDFRCESYAGDTKEIDREFELTVAIVTATEADEIRVRWREPYDEASDIPKIAGAWSSHSATAMRPAPDTQ